jgi:hypothetical protein
MFSAHATFGQVTQPRANPAAASKAIADLVADDRGEVAGHGLARHLQLGLRPTARDAAVGILDRVRRRQPKELVMRQTRREVERAGCSEDALPRCDDTTEEP